MNDAVEEALDQINNLTEIATSSLQELRELFIPNYDKFFSTVGISNGEFQMLADILEPACLTVLNREKEERPASTLIEGIGLVWVAPEDTSGMLWWRQEQGKIARKHHVFNPHSDSFYDYRNSIWFKAAKDTDSPVIVGPYIDSWGTDDHTLTVSYALRRGNSFMGVAAADLNLNNIATAVEAALSKIPGAVLIETENRVIASNLPLLTPGLRIDSYLTKNDLKVSDTFKTNLRSWNLVIIK